VAAESVLSRRCSESTARHLRDAHGGVWLVQNSTVTVGEHELWADVSWPMNRVPIVTTYVGSGNCSQFFDHPIQRRINGLSGRDDH
jgi:hypothetical protein